MPLLAHLVELRQRVIISGIALAVAMVISLFLVDIVYAGLTAPLRLVAPGAGGGIDWVDQGYRALIGPLGDWLAANPVDGKLAITTSPMEGMYTWFRVAFVSGVLLASPVITVQAWRFIAPGLYASERRLVYPLAASSTFLFALGAAFAWLVLIPIAMPFFLTILDVEAILSVDGYLQMVTRMMLAFGGSFQMPIGVWFLARLGLVDHIDLIRGFRYSVVAIFFVAAVITPPDVLTQVILAIPLVMLYGLSIGVARFATTKKRA